MAIATVEPVVPVQSTVKMELSIPEAQYVYQALQLTTPANGQFKAEDAHEGEAYDPVYDALGDALTKASAYPFGTLARVL